MIQKNRLFTDKALSYMLLAVIFFFSINTLNAQTVSANLRVNTTDYFAVSLDIAGKSIATIDNNVYAIWQGQTSGDVGDIYFAKSADGGQSFSTEVKIYDVSVTAYHTWPSIAVSQNGNIYIAWTAVTDEGSGDEYNIWFTLSDDGGSSFEDPLPLTTNGTCILPAIGAYGDNVYIMYADASIYPSANYYFVKSANNGTSFGSPALVNDVTPTATIKFEGLITITVDGSGNIYLAWVDGRRADGKGDIFFSKSTDSGENFSTDVMVNDINESGADSEQYLPSIAVDGSNVYVSFTDMRLGPDWDDNRVYMAKSDDGGSTFDTEVLLNDPDAVAKYHDLACLSDGTLFAAMNTFVDPNWGVWLFESTDGGDSWSIPVALSDELDKNYGEIRIIANSNEEILALWKDDREGADDENIYFAKADVSTVVIDNEQDDMYNIYPNPTTGRFSVNIPSESSETELMIYNITGQLFYRKECSNTSKIDIEIDMPPGTYFVKIKSYYGLKTLKLIKK